MELETFTFYRTLGERCTGVNITCTVCVTTPYYLDVATIGELCQRMGGVLKWLSVEDSDLLFGIRGGL